MTTKIKANDAYYIVSEDSSMDETALIQLASDIKKQTKITQPNFLIDMRFDYELVQLQALQKVTEQLQPIIKNNLDKSTTLFTSIEGASLVNDRQEVEIVIPLQSFGWARQYYPKLRAALQEISTIHVCYPKWSSKISKPLYGSGPICTYVAIHRDETNKRRELVHFFFSLEIATCLISPSFGFTKLLQQTLENSKNIYTTKIYMYICRAADKGKWIIRYDKLREILCIGEKYPRYYDFRNRIIKEVERELRQKSNHWFDLVECFPTKGAEAPSVLIFNIYSADNTNNGLNQLNLFRNKIYTTMTESLKIKKSAAQSIFRQINVRNAEYLWRKHNMLLAYIQDDETIKDIKAYYIGAMQQIIQTEKYNPSARQQTLF